MHPHLYELDAVNVSIQHNHRDAMRDSQVRVVRRSQPSRLTTIVMSLRTMRGRVQAPADSLEPVVAHEPTVTTANRTATA